MTSPAATDILASAIHVPGPGTRIGGTKETRRVFLEKLELTGFDDGRCGGTGTHRTSGHTQATFYTARKFAVRP